MNWRESLSTRLAVICATGFFLSTSFAGSGHQVPTAPPEYLSKKNPLEGKTSALERGGQLFGRKCYKCHGVAGDGKGPGASGLEPAPVAFANPGYLKSRVDGQLFWIIEKGSPNTAMDAWGPGTETNLSADDIWSVITFLRASFTK